MRHNEHYQHIARELMRRRLADLEAKTARENWRCLSVQEATERGQLQDLLSQTWRDCPECLGVGRVRFAYAAIMTRHGYMIARADEDQPGHTPQEAFETFPTYDAAKAYAKRLNDDLGLEDQEAAAIVTSSIRAQNMQEQNSQKGA
jgi:hypothetical protein